MVDVQNQKGAGSGSGLQLPEDTSGSLTERLGRVYLCEVFSPPIVGIQAIKYGLTPGCRGCIASNRGTLGVPHDDRCRWRIEDLIKDKEPERYMRTLERMCRNELGEERGSKRRAVEHSPTIPAQSIPVYKTYTEDGSSSSTSGTQGDINKHANADVNMANPKDIVKCPSIVWSWQHEHIQVLHDVRQTTREGS